MRSLSGRATELPLAATLSQQVSDLRVTLSEARGLKWYRSSETGRRAFCQECGSVLFWKGDGRDYLAIAAGSIDGKLGVPLEGHIFCDSAGDYYEIAGPGEPRRMAPP